MALSTLAIFIANTLDIKIAESGSLFGGVSKLVWDLICVCVYLIFEQRCLWTMAASHSFSRLWISALKSLQAEHLSTIHQPCLFKRIRTLYWRWWTKCCLGFIYFPTWIGLLAVFLASTAVSLQSRARTCSKKRGLVANLCEDSNTGGYIYSGSNPANYRCAYLLNLKQTSLFF